MNINELKGIGEKTEKVFNKAGIHTTDDLLKYYPRNYDIYEMPLWIRDFKCNQICAVKAIVYKQIEIRRVRNLQIVTAYLQDDTKNVIRATWFNAAYLKNTLKPGSSFVFRGMVKENRGAFVLEQPKIYKINEYKELLDNEDFKDASSHRTTNTENIFKRIELASKLIYGIKYER